MEKINVKEDDEIMKWVHDSSVDHKGRVPLRASTGSWKAALFIFGKGMFVNFLPKLLHSNASFIHNFYVFYFYYWGVGGVRAIMGKYYMIIREGDIKFPPKILRY